MTSGLQITEPSSEFWSLWWQCQAGGDSWVLSGDSDVSISGSWHHHMSRVKSGVTGAPAVTVWTMQGWSPPLMRPGSTPAHYWGSTRSRCRPTFVRGNIIWVRPSKYQQKTITLKMSRSREREVRRTFYHFHFPIFCRTSHLSSVAAVASLNRRLQCISGDKRRIANKYWYPPHCTSQIHTIVVINYVICAVKLI